MGKKPKKRAKPLPKDTAEWEALPDAEVMEHIFGEEGQQVLKDQALTNEKKVKKDYRLP